MSGYGRSQISKDAISIDSQDRFYLFQTHAGKRLLPNGVFMLPANYPEERLKKKRDIPSSADCFSVLIRLGPGYVGAASRKLRWDVALNSSNPYV